jgi:uncharacterized repeat protein (TIGR03806 family)
MRSHHRFILGPAVLLLVGTLAALEVGLPSPQPAPAAPPPAPAFECRWADTSITIDGAADDPTWKHAQPIEHFSLPWLGDAARPARTATKARLLWDREYLYFVADMEDRDLVTGDAFALYVRPAADKPGYFAIQVNAAGAVSARFHPRRGDDGSPLGEFRVEAVVKLRGTLDRPGDRDQGWSVEGRIPWVDFQRAGGRPEPGESWRFALGRTDHHEDGSELERSTCAPLRSPDFHALDDYAPLTFAGPDATSVGRPFGIASRVPLTTSTVVGSPDPPPPYRVKRVYPNYSPSYPILVKHVPGSDQLLVITEVSPYGRASLERIKDDPATTNRDAVKIMDFDGVAYDIAFHPHFADNGFVYIGWNGQDPASKKHFTRVTRYTMTPKPPHTFDVASAKLIIEWESNGHNGGAVCFGTDGLLYVTSGDGTSDSDTNLMGQRTDTLLAKVLRIDVDHPDGDRPYSVPKDNPFVGNPAFRPETWAYGLRNPWRITCDARTGHVWVGNNGQDLWEQAYLIRKGANYGWSVLEGSHPFYPNRQAGPTPFSPPTVEHHHSEARSLTGGIVYDGTQHPELRGAYLYGDYSTGRVWAARHDGSKVVWHRELAQTSLKITGFGTDARGEVLICDHQAPGQGALYTLEPTPRDDRPTTFPKKLSDGGLFAAVKDHRMTPGVVQYSVNAPFWSDGLHKERFLALPAGGRIGYTRSRGWDFPDRTVLVKSFAVEREEGNPASREWVETRFLTRQGGEWFGYSYVWDAGQSDAVLVGTAGMDREFTVRVPPSPEHPDGVRKLTWHYPSRAECMVCHSRAANFVLGLSELQMNKEHDYPGGVRDNQLRVFEHLGLLEVDTAAEAQESLRERAKRKGLSGPAADEYVQAHLPQSGQRAAKPSALLSRPPERLRSLVNPSDPSQDLTLRARSWLHANCSNCHVEAGGGNARMELEFTTTADAMRVLGEKPMHHTFGLPDARLIAPGHPERSVLLHRIGTRGPGQMPPLSTNRVDAAAVDLLRAWIAAMPDADRR